MIYLLVIPVIFYYQILLEHSIEQGESIRQHNKADLKELGRAENLSRTLNQIININKGLKAAAAACSAASIAPPVATAIKETAAATAKFQDLLIQKLSIIFWSGLTGEIKKITYFANSYRSPPQGICQIPGVIKFDKNNAGHIISEENKDSGYCIKASSLSRPNWHFCRMEGLL